MPLLTLRNVSLGFRGPPVLDRANLAVEPGERLCLLGRNGTGKTTLLRLIQGEIEPDRGEIVRQQGLRDRRCSPRKCPRDCGHGLRRGRPRSWPPGRTSGRVSSKWPAGWRGRGGERRTCTPGSDRIQHALEIDGGWSMHQEVEAILSRMSCRRTPKWRRFRPA